MNSTIHKFSTPYMQFALAFLWMSIPTYLLALIIFFLLDSLPVHNFSFWIIILSPVAIWMLHFVFFSLRSYLRIAGDILCIGHGWYTFELSQESVNHVGAERELENISTAGLSTKTNGVAFSGFAAGWFVDAVGRKAFAVGANKGRFIAFDYALRDSPGTIRTLIIPCETRSDTHALQAARAWFLATGKTASLRAHGAASQV